MQPEHPPVTDAPTPGAVGAAAPLTTVSSAAEPARVAPPPRTPGFRGSRPWGVVRALRPRQWVKNVLVLAAPLAAGRVLDPDVLGPTAVAFVLFCLAASAVYLVNDSIDVEEDRRHPQKRFRPIAAGIIPRPLAVAMAAVL